MRGESTAGTKVMHIKDQCEWNERGWVVMLLSGEKMEK